MKAAVVYESMFGNTAQVAEAIAEGMEDHGVEVTLLEVMSAPPDAVTGFDIVVIGAPTHGLTLSKPSSRRTAVRGGAPEEVLAQGVREWLPRVAPPSGVLAVYDTRARAMRHWPGSAAHAAARILRRRGVTPVERRSFYVAATKGPLLEGEIPRARAWGARLGGLARTANPPTAA